MQRQEDSSAVRVLTPPARCPGFMPWNPRWKQNWFLNVVLWPLQIHCTEGTHKQTDIHCNNNNDNNSLFLSHFCYPNKSKEVWVLFCFLDFTLFYFFCFYFFFLVPQSNMWTTHFPPEFMYSLYPLLCPIYILSFFVSEDLPNHLLF